MAQKTNTDTGKPSGVDKPMQGTGVPANVSNEGNANDQRLTDDYTLGDEELADGVREMHPNRNVDKNEATNAGGYRN